MDILELIKKNKDKIDDLVQKRLEIFCIIKVQKTLYNGTPPIT